MESERLPGQDTAAAVAEHVVLVRRAHVEVAIPTFAPTKWGLGK